jgi:hypothetical protein
MNHRFQHLAVKVNIGHRPLQPRVMCALIRCIILPGVSPGRQTALHGDAASAMVIAPIGKNGNRA